MLCYLSRNLGQSLRCLSRESSLEAVTVIEHSCLTYAGVLWVVRVQSETETRSECCCVQIPWEPTAVVSLPKSFHQLG